MSDRFASPVLQPVTLGGLQLKNRIVMAPMTRSRADDAGVQPDYVAEYYAQRASAGLIVTEATNISAQARGYTRTPGIWTEAQIAAWKRVTEAVHRQDGKIFLQLWHTGRMSHPDMHDGGLPVAPSAIKPHGQIRVHEGMKDFVTPRALETDEIPLIVEDYRRAAENAKLPALMVWRCIRRTTICSSSSCVTAPMFEQTGMAARWKTACAFLWRWSRQ